MRNSGKSQNDIAFWTGFYEGDDPIKWASNKAYRDMNRTLAFAQKGESKNVIDERKSWRDATTKIIEKAIEESTYDFKTWHEETCKAVINGYKGELVDGAKMTFGQAQKWINMVLKYLWLLYRLEVLGCDLNAFRFIERHQKSLYVPLDSYIKRYVEKQPKGKKVPNDNGLYKDIPEGLKWNQRAWSAIDGDNEINRYYEYQKELADSIDKKYSSPLEWELEHWHKALRFYE